MQDFPPLDHFDYGELDTHCGCSICADWRDSHALYQAALKGDSQDDYRGNKETMKLRSLYLAAVCRREAYCEVSYHASRLPCGTEMMIWMGRQIKLHDQNWWENIAPKTTLGEWFEWFAKEQSVLSSALADIEVRLTV